MKNEKHFQLKPEHIKLLRNAYLDWSDYETGAPAIDGKRPYGNSYVEGDIAEILGIKGQGEGGELTEEQAEGLLDLHRETLNALRIILQHGPEPGLYIKEKGWQSSWKKEQGPTNG